MYLALDQSKTCTGWAIGAPGVRVVHGAHQFKARPEHYGHFGNQVRDWVKAKIEDHNIQHVLYEAPQLPKGKAGQFFRLHDRVILFSMVVVIEMACADAGVPVSQAEPGDWRKDAYGFSRLPKHYSGDWKSWAVETAREQGFDVSTHDEAEAIGMLHHMLIQKHPEIAAVTGPLFRRVEKMGGMT